MCVIHFSYRRKILFKLFSSSCVLVDAHTAPAENAVEWLQSEIFGIFPKWRRQDFSFSLSFGQHTRKKREEEGKIKWLTLPNRRRRTRGQSMTEDDGGGCWCGAGQHMGDRHDRIIEMMRLKSISSSTSSPFSLLCLFIDKIFNFSFFFLRWFETTPFFLLRQVTVIFPLRRHLRPATRADPFFLFLSFLPSHSLQWSQMTSL